MKKIFLFGVYLILIFTVRLAGQQVADVHIDLSVDDLAGGSKTLTFGLDSIGTDGIDVALGESDLPPFPPAGAFEARFLLPPFAGALASWKDFRQALVNPYSGVVEYRLKYQVGTGTVIKISWDLPVQATGLLQDLFGGVIVNQPMSGTGNYTVTNLAIDQLKMVITYNSIPLPVELTSFTASVTGSAVTLNWQTATEVNNRGFEIQRKAENSGWESLGFVDGAGTSSQANLYSFVDNDVAKSMYTYRLKQVDFNGTFSYSKEVEVDLTLTNYKLYQNYPNPFNPNTNIRFAVPQDGFVTVKVYNMIGQEVVTLLSENTKTGIYSLNWNGKDSYGHSVSSGNYICKMTAGSFTESRKMILLK